jgi:hypothetical protein
MDFQKFELKASCHSEYALILDKIHSQPESTLVIFEICGDKESTSQDSLQQTYKKYYEAAWGWWKLYAFEVRFDLGLTVKEFKQMPRNARNKLKNGNLANMPEVPLVPCRFGIAEAGF